MNFKRDLLVVGLLALSGLAGAHTGPNPDPKEAQVDCRKVFNFTFPSMLEFVAKIDCNQFISSKPSCCMRPTTMPG